MERPDPLAPPEGYGSKLGRTGHLTGADRTAASTGMVVVRSSEDEGCGAINGQVRCGLPGNWYLEIGCISEHMSPADLCDRHYRLLLQRLAHGSAITCEACGLEAVCQRQYPRLPDGSLGEDQGPPPRRVLPAPPARLF